MTAIPLRLFRVPAKAGAASLRAGGILLGGLILLSLIARFFLPDPNSQQLTSGNLPPFSAGHPFGTDLLGRDVFTWCASGITTSLSVGLTVVVVSALVGVLVGTFAGYAGGWADAVLMRLVDLQLAVPPLLIFLAASMVITRNIPVLIVLLASVSWVPYARLVRARVLTERERGYIAAARLAGTRRLGIAFGHFVPACTTPIIVYASLHIGFVMLAESALSFLGLGLEPPTVSLGYLISQGRNELTSDWWIATFPGVMIVLLVVATNLIGDGLRDRFHLDSGDV
ncbi:ABC transporter permease [Sciscionella marina]|uniref:ABC transporter permease n=1 Tax=Sciscionella marina TaxID=508770 RepID=UPI00037786CD|nr:ABC transporter permease [Sciscionella marina]